MSTLRYYTFPECDPATGYPLDWDRCRMCEATGRLTRSERWGATCLRCDGHGSLKAAALAHLITRCGATDETPAGMATCNRPLHEDRWHSDIRDGELWAGWGGGEPHPYTIAARCEDCGHPMSEGTWEDTSPGRPENDKIDHEAMRKGYAAAAWKILSVDKQEPTKRIGDLTLYSPCDEGCRHGGGPTIRYRVGGERYPWKPGNLPDRPVAESIADANHVGGIELEASWRPVDVRLLDRPCMLEPSFLAILCLRCYAKRTTPL